MSVDQGEPRDMPWRPPTAAQNIAVERLTCAERACAVTDANAAVRRLALAGRSATALLRPFRERPDDRGRFGGLGGRGRSAAST